MYNINSYGAENPDLTQKLLKFLSEIDINEQLEVKPVDALYLDKQTDHKTKEEVNIETSTKLDKQIQIISNNIVIKFFELSDQKFKAIMARIQLWRL